MITHDFYKLMQLPRHADNALIKKTYYKLALKYHPDKNPDNAHADEYFKTVTQGYHVLSNPSLRAEYDYILDLYYTNKELAHQRAVRYHARNYEEVSAKVKAIKELRREQMITNFIEKQKAFPITYRYILAVLVLISGALMSYNHWFIDESDFDYIFIVFGFLVYSGGVYLLCNYLYQHLSFLYARGRLRSRVEKVSMTAFLSLFFLGPLMMFFVTQGVKSYQLSNYGAMVVPQSIIISGGQIYYKYRVFDHTYEKSSSYSGNGYDENSDHYRVRYSTENPKVAELIKIQ